MSASESTYQLLTSPGPSAIAVVQVCGALVDQLRRTRIRLRGSHDALALSVGSVLRAELLDADGVALDDIVVTVHASGPRPNVRLHLHGSPAIVQRCIELLKQDGFTAAAGLHADIWPAFHDIFAREAYALLPSISTLRGARWVLAQAESLRSTVAELLANGSIEQIRAECARIAGRAHLFRYFTQPLRVALVGPPNAGKSTLANALADQTVSLVSAVPGTTRDWIETPGEVAGLPVVWIDTAGLRDETDALEAAGIARTRRQIENADAILVVIDVRDAAAAGTASFVQAMRGLRPSGVVLNKIDVENEEPIVSTEAMSVWSVPVVRLSAAKRIGLDALKAMVAKTLWTVNFEHESPSPYTPRQVRYFERLAIEDGDAATKSLLIGLQIDPAALVDSATGLPA